MLYITRRKVVGGIVPQVNHTRSVYVCLRSERGSVSACVMESCAATLAIVFTIQHARWKKQQRIKNIDKIECFEWMHNGCRKLNDMLLSFDDILWKPMMRRRD